LSLACLKLLKYASHAVHHYQQILCEYLNSDILKICNHMKYLLKIGMHKIVACEGSFEDQAPDPDLYKLNGNLLSDRKSNLLKYLLSKRLVHRPESHVYGVTTKI
jgi:hypothetical protein